VTTAAAVFLKLEDFHIVSPSGEILYVATLRSCCVCVSQNAISYASLALLIYYTCKLVAAKLYTRYLGLYGCRSINNFHFSSLNIYCVKVWGINIKNSKLRS
jgi:hypothetical protein